MKSVFAIFFLILGIFTATCFAQQTAPAETSAAPPATSGLTENLVSKLGITTEQATGAAGALFQLAKGKLSADDFGKIAGKMPEMDNLLKMAPAADPLTSNLGTLGLVGSFQKLGISTETAAKVVPEVLSFVKEKYGTEMMDLLGKVVK